MLACITRQRGVCAASSPTRRFPGAEAVVIGSGIAGLLTARVLATRFARVTVLERDELPDGPALRKKTAQAPHSHVFGAHGYQVVTALFPGIDDDLRDAGAPVFDHVSDCRSFTGAWAPRHPSGLTIRIATRMLLEWRMRARLLEHSNVRIVTGRRVTGLVMSAAGDRVIGVVSDGDRKWYADLVVDSSGLGSRARQWLTALGLERPRESTVDMKGAFVTRVFRPPPDADTDWVMLSIKSSAGNPRSAAVMRIEHGLWRVSMHGWSGTSPPRDPHRFLAFARDLPHPAVYEAIKDAVPVSPVYYYGRSMSRWIHYDELRRFPDGLVIIGDAVFHANPEHAQGMTFCVRAVELLARTLDRDHAPALAGACSACTAPGRFGASRAFQRQLARMYEPYWIWNTGIELCSPGVIAARPGVVTRLLHRYQRQLRAVALCDHELRDAVLRVHQGERNPSSLLRPAILGRALKTALLSRHGSASSAPPAASPAVSCATCLHREVT